MYVRTTEIHKETKWMKKRDKQRSTCSYKPETSLFKVNEKVFDDETQTLKVNLVNCGVVHVVTVFKNPPSCFAIIVTVTPLGFDKITGLYQFFNPK